MTWTRKPPPGAAYSNISEKTGRGRTTTGEAKVPEVETVECDRLPVGPHELAKRMVRGDVVVACVWCLETWSSIDAGLRGAA